MIRKTTSKDEVLKFAHPCKCDACSNGCVFGSGSLIDEDYEKIAKHLDISVEELKSEYLEEVERFNTKRHKPKLERKKDMPYGKCIFYNKGCKIHDVKPMECKVAMLCKDYGPDMITWFNLNYYVNPKDPESVRQWAQYLVSGGNNIEGGELKDIVENKEKLKEILEYKDLHKGLEKDWEKELGLK